MDVQETLIYQMNDVCSSKVYSLWLFAVYSLKQFSSTNGQNSCVSKKKKKKSKSSHFYMLVLAEQRWGLGKVAVVLKRISGVHTAMNLKLHVVTASARVIVNTYKTSVWYAAGSKQRK